MVFASVLGRIMGYRKREEDRIGTCPVCFGEFKVGGAGMVLHGWRSYQGLYTKSSCVGTDQPPYEVSPEGCHAGIRECEELRAEQMRELEEFRTATRITQPVREGHRLRPAPMIRVDGDCTAFWLAGTEEFAKRQEAAIAKREKAIANYDAAIARLRERIANWKPGTVPGITEQPSYKKEPEPMTEQAPVDFKSTLPATFDDNVKGLCAKAFAEAGKFLEGFKKGNKELYRALSAVAKFHAAATADVAKYKEALKGYKFRIPEGAGADDLYGLSIRLCFGFLPAVVGALSEDDRKTHENAMKDASRWATALRYAASKVDAPEKVGAWLEANGGIGEAVKAARVEALPPAEGQGSDVGEVSGSGEGPSADDLNALWDEIMGTKPDKPNPGRYLAFVTVDEAGKSKIINYVPPKAVSVDDVLQRVHDAMTKAQAKADKAAAKAKERAAAKAAKAEAKAAERQAAKDAKAKARAEERAKKKADKAAAKAAEKAREKTIRAAMKNAQPKPRRARSVLIKPDGTSDLDWVVKLVGDNKSGAMTTGMLLKKCGLGTAAGDAALKAAVEAGKLALKPGGVVALVRAR